MRSYLHALGMRWFPVVGWAERRYAPEGHGNSLPRFHITWGTGTGVVKPYADTRAGSSRASRWPSVTVSRP